jgi:hypothetical protein
MNNLIKQRLSVYEGVVGYNDASLPGLVYFFDTDLKTLSKSVSFYLEKSLELFYNKKYSIESIQDLEKYRKEISGLPNVTPNGQILPKNETAVFLNNVQLEIIKILDRHGLTNYIQEMMCVHVMIKYPNENIQTQERPYYTGKIHSDAWVGHHGDAIFMAGVLGDVEGSTVEYFEPINPNKDFLKVTDDFKKAQERYTGKNYIGKMKQSTLVLMDHTCLHRTKYEDNSKTRISINFGALLKNNSLSKKIFKSIDIIKESGGPVSYFTVDQLRKVGNEMTFFVEENLEQCLEKFKKSNVLPKTLPNNGIVIRRKNKNV